ncbi:MAG TPA: V-type ATP synthase subunit A [Gemmatimonadales bacterium]|nr:V-type ATP synthase subunit A [Gemmatimonadales bacterium]
MTEVPRVIRIAGALTEVAPLPGAALHEIVRVGERGLLGEVIRVRGDVATVQVFEDTTGLALEEPVAVTGAPLEVELGPGLLGSVLDGIGRPLERLAALQGDFLGAGAAAPTLDPARRWRFTPALEPGVMVGPGDVLGTVPDRNGEHRILVPPGMSGRLAALTAGEFTIHDPIGRLEDGPPLCLAHRWPVRVPRPVASWRPGARPFVTGQRVFDFLFPVAEGGSVAVPGGFGTGKTVIEQSLAKYAEADIVVYVGCGERGNEMADVLTEFPELVDPRTGRTLMDRAVLVVNTSNMPVAAREASVYLGLTVAEYFRDQGCRVALMADSLSRWAEALREIGSRLREMPGEEGYPTGLGSRLGKLCERAGRAQVPGRPVREGAVTFISALSPPGGDLSEPVTQAAGRVVAALWALDAGLAHQRQFPAVDWETSWSLQADAVAPWFTEHVGADWPALRREVLALLQRDRELRDVAGLVGPDALEDVDRLVLEAARLARECLLGQSAYDPADASSTLAKTRALAALLVRLLEGGRAALSAGAELGALDLTRARRALVSLRDGAPADLEATAAGARAEVEASLAPSGVTR